MMMSEYDKLCESLKYVQSLVSYAPKMGIICGSGLGTLGDIMDKPITIPYSDIPHFPKSTVVGHSGELVFGEKDNITLVCMRGRVHLYEGYDVIECIRPVRLMAMLGISVLCVTNAAGNMNKNFKPGDFMIIKDHISFPSLAGENPLRGPHDKRLGERFVSMSNAYDPQLIAEFEAAGAKLGETLRKGVYAMVVGPTYETIAEGKALKLLGADAIGMSTVHEIIAAHQMGVRCLAVSLLTNDVVLDYDASQDIVEHSDVVEMGARRSKDFIKLILAFTNSVIKSAPNATIYPHARQLSSINQNNHKNMSTNNIHDRSAIRAQNDLSDMRKPYRDQDDGIEESNLPTLDPIKLFADWFQKTKESNTVYEPNAFCISTASKSGQPSARMVLLKGFDDSGFRFFSHSSSQKGRNISENPKVAMLFYWDSFNRQVRIEGSAKVLDSDVAQDYFQRRPQSSQIGAAISDQCSLVESRDELMKRFNDLKTELGEKAPPKPNTWNGYLVVPEVFEFWQGNTNRVHDRIIFRKPKSGEKPDGKLTKSAENGWLMERMMP